MGDVRAGNAVGVEDEGANNPPDTGLGGWGSGGDPLNQGEGSDYSS